MMTEYEVLHTTHYSYPETVSHCHNIACLLPRNTHEQTVLEAELSTDPKPKTQHTRTDYFGNQLCYFSVESPHSKLDIKMRSKLTINRQPLDLSQMQSVSCNDAQLTPDNIATSLAYEYLLESPMIPTEQVVTDFANPFFAERSNPVLNCVNQLMQFIFNEFQFDPEFTSVATPIKTVLEHKRGVCQDFAHLAIACLRSQGLAARYVSGYIETLPPPGQEKLVGSDASHAWVSVFVPNHGWYDFDPTNNCWIGSQHLITAWGRDYSDVSPLKGIIFGGGKQQQLSVAVDVNRIETPVSESLEP